MKNAQKNSGELLVYKWLIPESISEKPKLDNSVSINLALISHSLQCSNFIYANIYFISLLF